MVAGLDSSTDRPTPAIIAQAYAAGVRLWSGYLATRPNVGLQSPWDLASFDIARQLGGKPIGFCSGWDDPVGLRSMAAAWNVRLCLDVEGGGLRPDGSWVQPWLDASGAGLYGVPSVHAGRGAAFHVLADYLGPDPGATWNPLTPRPAGPVGWQWIGGHSEFGLDVDRGWYDDWFGGDPLDPATLALLQAFLGDYTNPDYGLRRVFYGATDSAGVYHPGLVVETEDLETRAQQVQAAIAKLSQPDVNALAAALASNQAFVDAVGASAAKQALAALAAQLAKP